MTSSTVGKDGRADARHKEPSDVTETSCTKCSLVERVAMAMWERRRKVAAVAGINLDRWEDELPQLRTSVRDEASIAIRAVGYLNLFDALEGLIEAVRRDSDEGGKGISGYTSARLHDAREAVAQARPGDTVSADGGGSFCASSLNTSSLPQITSIDARVKELEDTIDLINRTCHIPTGPNQKAYTHFARDFDKIRSLCRSALSQGSPGQ